MKLWKILMVKAALFVLLFFATQNVFANTPENCEKMIVTGVKAMSERKYSQSLEILTKAQEIAKENNWYRQEFLALNNIGANFYEMLDYGEAINNYLEAYKIALMHLDYKSEMTVLNNIAILYSQDKKYSKSEEYFLKAYELATKSKDSVKIGIYAINIATVANETKQWNKSSEYIHKAFEMLKSKELILQTQTVQVENFILRKKFTEASKLAFTILPQLKGIQHKENRVAVLLLLSQISRSQNDFLAAIKYCQQALEENDGLLKKEIIFQNLSEIYEQKADLKQAMLYKDSVLIVHDSINVIKNGRLFENSRIKFELQNSQKNLADSNKKLKTERLISIISISGVLLLIGSVFLFFRNKNIRMKQEKVIEENTKKIIELELEQEKKDKEILLNHYNENEIQSLLQQEILKNEIETKNRKLLVKALQLSGRNDLVESVIQSLMLQPGIEDNISLKNSINLLKQCLREENQQTEFLLHFEEVNQGFLQKLNEKHPTLTSNDLRFLSYGYMNLSSKEISSLLNITLDACRKRKERIARKMNLTKEDDLFVYLSSI